MKKIYSLFLLALSMGVSVMNSQTCLPDPQYASTPGIFPDSATNFVSGTVGVAYNQNITVTIPTDTVVFGNNCSFDHADLVSISNLPPGLSYMCSPSNCKWNGGTSGCSAIYGTPTTAGTYTLDISVDAYVCGSPFAYNNHVTYYKIVINPQVGMSENSGLHLEVKQNAPNPFQGKTTVRFVSPTEDKVKFTVCNMLGKVILEKKVDAVKGDNEIEVDAKNLAGGMYFYTLEYKGKTITRRMMVDNN